MKILFKYSISQRLVATALLVLFVIGSVYPDSFNKYVGQSFVLPIPKCPVSSGFVNSWSYSCSSTNINITNRGNSNPSEAVITSYFDGSLTIECFFQYIYYVNNIPRSGTSREYHRVTCNSNNISISGSKNRLTIGETVQLSYRFSTTTYNAQPVITWRSTSNAVSVNSGLVTALNPGKATITATSNLGNNVASYEIEVMNPNPVSVKITPTTNSIYCDSGLQLYASVSPSEAPQSVSWSLLSGSSNATISNGGFVRGLSPGIITVKATAANGVFATKDITVIEPAFSYTGSTPSNDAANITAFIKPSVSYSLDIYKGSNFSAIMLQNIDKGINVSGTPSCSGHDLTFLPSKPLDPQTNYKLTIPANAIKNKWNTHYASEVNVSFKTGEWEKLGLTTSIKSGFISPGEKLTLKASVASARIYYTLDGSLPTEHSSLYSDVIILETNTKLRAVAVLDGYKNSDIVSEDYLLTNVNVVKRFPDIDTKMYEYKDVNPYITYSNIIEPSENLNGVTLIKDGRETINGHVIVADSSIFYIPETPLRIGCRYEISIPADAIKTWQGESNDATSWSFVTGDYVTGIAMGGPELAMATKTDGSFQTWGMLYKSGNVADGSYSMALQLSPSSFTNNDFRSISSGYMHHAIVKNDGSLWMWGRQYCGEFGNNSTTGSAKPLMVMDGVQSVSCGGQTTAIIMDDGSLWMCGRNDFGQIGDSTVENRLIPVKIMDNVVSAVAGWCNSYAVKEDGSLWAWGRNDKNQLGNGTTEDSWIPVKVMENVHFISACSTESQWVAVIKNDGTLWVWGETQPSPTELLYDVKSVAVGVDYVEAIKKDGSLWAFGNNAFGQLGNGTTIAATKPIKIMDGVAEVVSGGQTTMVLMNDGSVLTWGRNNFGTIGNGSLPSLTAHITSPIEVFEGHTSSPLIGVASRKSAYSLDVGTMNVIDALPVPLNATYNDLSWASSNENVASVSQRGVVTGLSPGVATLTIKIKSKEGKDLSANFKVTVTTNLNNGDVNGDGKVNAIDLNAIVNYILERRTFPFSFVEKAADLNGDQKINAIDVNMVTNMILGRSAPKNAEAQKSIYVGVLEKK